MQNKLKQIVKPSKSTKPKNDIDKEVEMEQYQKTEPVGCDSNDVRIMEFEEIDPFDDPVYCVEVIPSEDLTTAQAKEMKNAADKALRLGVFKLSKEIIELNERVRNRHKYEVYNPDGTLAVEATTRWNKFLNVLEKVGIIAEACRQSKISTSVYYSRYNKSEKFRRLVDEAMMNSTQILRDEAMKRAVYGVEKPIWYKGVRVGTDKVYSDSLLLALLKSRDPSFKEEVKNININSTVIDPTPTDNFESMRKLLSQDYPEAEVTYDEEEIGVNEQEAEVNEPTDKDEN